MNSVLFSPLYISLRNWSFFSSKGVTQILPSHSAPPCWWGCAACLLKAPGTVTQLKCRELLSPSHPLPHISPWSVFLTLNYSNAPMDLVGGAK